MARATFTLLALFGYFVQSQATVQEWLQCGGIGYTGETQCDAGLMCQVWNPYYSQCIPSTSTSTTMPHTTSTSTKKTSSTKTSSTKKSSSTKTSSTKISSSTKMSSSSTKKTSSTSTSIKTSSSSKPSSTSTTSTTPTSTSHSTPSTSVPSPTSSSTVTSLSSTLSPTSTTTTTSSSTLPTSTTSSTSVISSTSSSTVVSSSSTSTPPPTSSSTATSTSSTYTGTLPIIPESATGLAQLAKPYGKYIGSAYDYPYVSDKNYTAIVLANVDQFTCENSMKWDSIEQSEGDFSTSYYADNVVEISQLNGMTMRGHCLVWYSQLPTWVTSGNWTNATLTEVMINHITGEMSLYKGEIFTWDVVNEALNDDGTMRQSIFYDTIGETFIDIAFNTAKSVDPKPILAINDYNIEGAGAKATAMINLVTRVKARGAPIEQIGIQGHLIVGSLPGNMVALWNQYVALGVSVAITELDIRMTLPATDALLSQQATDYVHMVTVCLDVPQCLGITFWGLSDMYSWVPATFSGQGGADLFDANMQPKPAYTALQALLGGTSTSSVSPTSSTSTISSTTTPPPSSTASSTTSTQTYTGTLPIYPESPTGLATLAKAYGKYIGSAYDYPYVSDKNYTDIVLANVDQFTCENSMKWDSIEQTEGDFSTSFYADKVVQISQLNGMTMRGHCLVWYSQLPTWVTSGNWTNATLTEVMINHITGEMSLYKGEIFTWDVVNEALNDDGTMRQSIFYDTIGETFIDIAFNTAKSIDSKPILAINDYNIEGAGAKATGMINLVTRVKARGAPIEQIGIQGHLIVGSLPGNMVALWNQYVALGVSVAITELDIRMTLPATDALLSQQATDYVHMVTVCLDVPQCLGITFWGLSDMYSWVPATFSGQGGADLFDANMQPKPAYTALQALLGGTSTSSASPTSSTSTISSTTTPPPSSTASSTTSTQTYTGTLPIYPESPTGLATLAKAYGKYIGSAYDYPYVSDKNYTDIVLANVDQFTCENSMKWDSIEQTEGDFSTSFYADNVVQISQLNGMTMRGHCLVWYSQLPNWVTSGNWTNATLTEVMINHITGEMSLYKGEIFTWDVVNEALNDDGTMRSTIFYDTIGETFIDIAFNTAKSVDPKPILAINDYNIEGAGAKATAMINLVTRVKARGAPIEQIGIQGHLIVGSLPGNIVALWNQYVALGVSVALTELDIRMTLPATDALLAQQATDYVHMVTACLDVPQCLGITFWGLSDMYSWVPATFSGQGGADLFDSNMQPKPAYTALQALLGGGPTSSVSATSTTSSAPTSPPSSTTSSPTTTQTYTGTLPIYPESPTGLAILAKPYGKYIGSAYDYNYVSDKNYTDVVLANVDQFTCENSMKWDSIEQTEGDFSTSYYADNVVQISQLNGMTMRGHCLVWYSQLPNWVTSGNWTNATLTQVMINHIIGEMSLYKGEIFAWDVVNEALNDDGTMRSTIFYDTIGETFIDIAFNTAKSVDPKPILAINDYNIEGAGAKATAMIDLVTRVKARGAPIEQIGIQGHLIVGSLPGNMVALWNQYVALGVSVVLTELDIRMTLPATDALLAQQATDYVHMVTVCLDIPQCLGITFWGLSDLYSWVPATFSGQGGADLFDANMQPKPAYAAIQALLEGTSTSVTPTSTSVTPTSTMSSTATQPPTSTTASSTSTQTYTGTLPIDPESPTGLAVLAKSYGKYIGSAYDNAYISDKNYTSIVLGNVDQLTCENSMKWDSIEQTEGDFSTSLWADRVVQISQLNGMTMRGHCLVWYSQLPTWVTSGNWTNATMTQVMVNHITGVMSKYKGQIYIWDVVNEALNDDGTLRQSIFYNLIGETYIDIAFNTAKSVDPTPILAINDYNIEGAGAKATAMIDLVTRVKARGAPIEQIGIQGHLIVGSLPGNMVALWNQYVALGVSVAITELDIRMTLPTTDALLSQQATDYVHMVTVCLDVPQCLGITFWGLSDEYSWVPSTFSGQGAADLFDANMQPKPAYSAVQNLLETF